MRRLFRILFSAATIASLVLCMAIVLLWIRSYWVEDHVGHLAVSVKNPLVSEHRSGLFSGEGRLAIGTGDLEETQTSYLAWPHPALRDFARFGWDTTTSSWVDGEYDDEFPFGFAFYPGGHGVYSSTPGYRSRGYFVSVPHWFVALLLGLYPLWRLAAVAVGRTPSPRHVAIVYGCLIGLAAVTLVSGLLSICTVPIVVAIGAGTLIRRYAQARAARRPLSGFCPKCDYDLRATPQRCPKCGTSTAAVVTT